MKDFLVIVILLFVALFGGLMFLWNALGEYQCSNYAKVTGRDTRWTFLDSCYIRTSSGEWQRWDEYKVRGVASEGLKR